MRRAIGLLVVAGLAAAPARAGDAPVDVNIEFQQFSPSQIDVLPGETVAWTNGSERRHTVTANDESFDSGDLFGGDNFSQEFDAVGSYPYHCRVHLGMTGEVDVRRVILDPVLPGPIPAGQPVEVSGRTSDPGTPVDVELDTGQGFRSVATTTPAPDGTWSVTTPAAATGDYRAASGPETSESRRVLVTDRKLFVRATRRGVHVVVVPAARGARVLLQVDSRERFGWFPVSSTRLDYLSRADFKVAGGSRVRVVLADTDGWTPVALSPIVQVRAH